ncbi:N-6 DNA methylase [Companilactobacillus metriopterae]|uniref:N-6 DNA methylase n=1 Tax=Companilactobacillus metriopterae TaxID=1909267 RepID=UPI00100A3645|nr:N-6 DNA methylase [Companilactobacillus metriopterae]
MNADLFGIENEFYKMPDKLKNILFDKQTREDFFRKFLEEDSDLSKDQFHELFMSEMANRKKKKQDFTPDSVAQVLNKLSEFEDDNYFELAAGSGGLAIAHWWQECQKEFPWEYRPSEHFHYLEELDELATLILIFNMSIRGMNAVIVMGDSLDKTASNVFLIQNYLDDPMGFSDVNIVPCNELVEQTLDIKFVNSIYEPHIETPRGVNIRKRNDADRFLNELLRSASN